MPQIALPDGTAIDFPDQPTSDDLGKLQALKDHFDSMAQASKPSTGMSMATGGAMDTNANPVPGMPAPGTLSGRITQGIGQSILPIGGQIAGGIAGGLASPFTAGIANPVTGEMAGGAAGEWLNQKMGITQPSGMQIGLAAAAPLAGRAIGWGINKAIKTLPPAIRAMHEMGAKEAEQIPATYLEKAGVNPNEVSGLYEAAKQAGGKLPMDDVADTISNLTKQIPEKGTIGDTLYNKFRAEVTKLNNTISANPEGLDIDTFQKTMKSIGDLKYVAGRAGTANESKFASLYASTWKTLNEAADKLAANQAKLPGPQIGNVLKDAEGNFIEGSGPDLLKKAINAAKASNVAEDLAGHINDAISYRAGSGEAVGVNGAKILNAIESDKLLMKTIDPQIYNNEIKPIIAKINRIPAMPPPTGAQYGSGRGIIRGAIGGLVGGAFGAPRVGAEVSLAAPSLVSQALQTEPGRVFLNKILDSSNGEITKKSLSILAGIVRANTASAGNIGYLFHPETPTMQAQEGR